jgi:trk system potassium uptake protein
MKLLIVGCGRVGAELAMALSIDGHEVVIVDRNSDAFRRLRPGFRGTSLEGAGSDRAVLERAGVARADGFATVTDSDSTNFVLAAMARWRYQVPRVVARIYDPVRADIYRHLGIPTVSPTVWGATRLKELLTFVQLAPLVEIGSGEVQMVEVEVSSRLEEHTIGELEVPQEIRVASVVRTGRGFIPTASTVLHTGDKLYIVTQSAAISRLETLLGLSG